ncbi:unnamed protein product [Larinioides sclopetarius]|uniref:Uncharacterized protein n=1 Tax=Larinioides sclopetarius TaxID=280406 RepID=A0AAV2ASN3_9ARAC
MQLMVFSAERKKRRAFKYVRNAFSPQLMIRSKSGRFSNPALKHRLPDSPVTSPNDAIAIICHEHLLPSPERGGEERLMNEPLLLFWKLSETIRFDLTLKFSLIYIFFNLHCKFHLNVCLSTKCFQEQE